MIWQTKLKKYVQTKSHLPIMQLVRSNNAGNIIAPLIQTAHDLQKKYGDVNLQKVLTTENGIWHSEVCVNAITKLFHTEA